VEAKVPRRTTTFQFGGPRVRPTWAGNEEQVTDPPVLTAVIGGLPDQAADLVGRLDTCLRALHAVQRDLDGQIAHCRRAGLPVDEAVLGRLVDTTRQAKRQLAGQQQALLGHASTEVLSEIEPVLRYGIATLAYVRGALASGSPSFQRAHVPVVADPAAAAARVEELLLDVFGLSPDEHGVTVTTSGAAAYSLVEGFLLRERLLPGDTLLVAPTVHPDVRAQVATLPFVGVRTSTGYATADLVADVLRYRPGCVFVDPLGSTAAQRMIDLPALLDGLRSTVTWRTTVVVDGTAVSGVLPAQLGSDDNVEVLYYERGAALQLGLDAGVAGVVAHPAGLAATFQRLRRNAGVVPEHTAAELFPVYDDDSYRWRRARVGGNALRLASLLRDDPRVGAAAVCHPGLAGHPDAELARRLHQPGVVTLSGPDADRLAERIAERARRDGVDIVTGPGAAPSVTVVQGTGAAFVRLCVGDRVDQVDLLAEACAAALDAERD
jgi:cystathionine beta-lyase/cystathionine gamma-synthase